MQTPLERFHVADDAKQLDVLALLADLLDEGPADGDRAGVAVGEDLGRLVQDLLLGSGD